MKKGAAFLLNGLKNIVGIILALGLLCAVPTGWLYDLWAGEGTGQGQRPTEEVRQVTGQEDVEAFFLAETPATVTDGEMVACPLMRLRDVEQEGVHYYRRRGRTRTTYISEYKLAGYPLSKKERLLQTIVGGSLYNRYYLKELSDGSWLCVYFDDYLALTDNARYPTGYVRYTTTEERRMLDEMAEDYDLNTVYVLDMYRHGKASWVADGMVRIVMMVVVIFVVVTVQGMWKKRRTED